MSKYQEQDFINLQSNFPESFIHLELVTAKRELIELKEYCNKLNKENDELKLAVEDLREEIIKEIKK